MSKEAMKLALEALRMPCNFWNKVQFIRVNEAIKALEEALKQEHGEPVAYFNPQVKGGFYWAKPTKITAPITVSVEPMPLYTTPQQRKPLTDEQIFLCVPQDGDLRSFARAIEAKLKEKNT